jgi:hypothetical protein
MYREVKDATIKNSLKHIDPFFGGWVGDRRIGPRDCIAWAMNKGIGIPDALSSLEEMLPVPLAFEFDPDAQTYPEELDIALIAWRAVSNKFDQERPVKVQISTWLDSHYSSLSGDQKKRIATVCNWQKSGGRPKSR